MSGASSSEKPGAQTGADAEGLVSDGTKPPGVNVLRRVRPRHLRRERAGRLERARRECVGHQRIARRVRSAGCVGAPAESDNGNG